MADLCSQASCGNCGRCTADYKRQPIIDVFPDMDYFEFMAFIARVEARRVTSTVPKESDKDTEPRS